MSATLRIFGFTQLSGCNTGITQICLQHCAFLVLRSSLAATQVLRRYVCYTACFCFTQLYGCNTGITQIGLQHCALPAAEYCLPASSVME
jgi:uncharacterized membrane protein YtjA (UPF0391 family)